MFRIAGPHHLLHLTPSLYPPFLSNLGFPRPILQVPHLFKTLTYRATQRPSTSHPSNPFSPPVSDRPKPNKDKAPYNPRRLPAMTAEEVSHHIANYKLRQIRTEAFTLKISDWPPTCIVLDKKTREPLLGPRVAYVNSKKAVDNRAFYRNHARRRLNQAAESILPRHAVLRCDYLFFLREACISRPMADLRKDIHLALKHLNCLRDSA
ncbi:MAG: hypothetical protein DHS80DRAFT_33744 [Piptocephalis tieghemiana]|nr:MAG: hypothetical protein DHS80DRAFT_33744 [Piptocephalis tieghemiana]